MPAPVHKKSLDEMTFEEVLDDVTSHLDASKIQRFIKTNKLPKSDVIKIYGKIPDQIASMVVDDDEFYSDDATSSTPNIESNVQENKIEEIPEIGKIEQAKEPKKTESVEFEPELPKRKSATDIDEISEKSGIPKEVVDVVMRKLLNEEDDMRSVRELVSLNNSIRDNSSMSKSAIDMALSKMVVDKINKQLKKGSNDDIDIKDIFNKIILMKMLESMSTKQDNSNNQIMQLLVMMMKYMMDKPRNENNISDAIRAITEQYNRMYKEMMEKQNMIINNTIQTLKDALKKSDDNKIQDDLKRLSEAIANLKTGNSTQTIEDISRQIEKLTKSSAEFLKGLGYKVEKSDSADTIEKIFNSKLGSTLLEFISNPEKLEKMVSLIRKSPYKEIPEANVGEDMPSL